MDVRLFASLIGLLLLSGCGGGEAVGPVDPALVRGNNEFAVALYKQLGTSPGNIVMSPYSISVALAMTYDGARGGTAQEMKDVLRFPLDREQLPAAMYSLNAHLTRRSDGLDLNIANALWGQTGFPFEQPFLDTTRRFYGGGLRQVQFPEPGRTAVNDRVKQETRGRIVELLAPGDVTANTRLVLTNAIFMKGKWAVGFDKASTRPFEFRLASGEKIQTPAMRHHEEAFPYWSDSSLEVLELPYLGKKASLIVFLPAETSSLAALESTLTAEAIEDRIGRLKETTLDVSLPRVKNKARFYLKDDLESLGMKLPFSDLADFSGMSPVGLMISKVIHEANIDIDEEGTVAVAATAVEMPTSLGPNMPHFNANRPFLYLIYDRTTGTILFLGRVTDPRS